jgi:predicted nuclease of predicted toxin-antitoxin system
MLRLLADENINHDLLRGALRRQPKLDVMLVQAVGLSQADDPEILSWAAREGRVVLTHDVNTMTRFAFERVQRGEPMAGVFIVRQQGAALSRIIDDLLLLNECSDTSEWDGQILFLPLR